MLDPSHGFMRVSGPASQAQPRLVDAVPAPTIETAESLRYRPCVRLPLHRLRTRALPAEKKAT